jgi:hypothetical protein
MFAVLLVSTVEVCKTVDIRPMGLPLVAPLVVYMYTLIMSIDN